MGGPGSGRRKKGSVSIKLKPNASSGKYTTSRGSFNSKQYVKDKQAYAKYKKLSGK